MAAVLLGLYKMEVERVLSCRFLFCLIRFVDRWSARVVYFTMYVFECGEGAGGLGERRRREGVKGWREDGFSLTSTFLLIDSVFVCVRVLGESFSLLVFAEPVWGE